jgi:hypothetical protein
MTSANEKDSTAPPSTGESSLKDGKHSTARELSNWLAGYAEYTSESESPETFHLWTGLSVIASVLKRNVCLNQGIYSLYPHMFVILVGPPGKVAKTTTIKLGRRLLLGVEGIHFGPDSCTREELIRQLAKVGQGQPQAAMTIHSKELSDLIDPSGITMISFLTTIYDGDDSWIYATKGAGRDNIGKPSLNLIAGTTPSWIADGLPADIIGHGFIARVIFVYEQEPRYLKPFPKAAPIELVRALTNDLSHMSRLEGEFTWGKGSKKLYASMYRALAQTQPKDYRIEGFHNRKKIHVLKVAMLLSVSESDDLVIYPRDLDAAWTLLKAVERDMARAFSAVGKHEQASNIERILLRIEIDGGMSQKEIYNEFFAMGGDVELQAMLTMLEKMGRIKAGRNDKGILVYLPTALV